MKQKDLKRLLKKAIDNNESLSNCMANSDNPKVTKERDRLIAQNTALLAVLDAIDGNKIYLEIMGG